MTLQAAVKFVTGLFMPKMPKLPKSAGQGDKLGEANAKGNQVKINTPIREVAGRRKVYRTTCFRPGATSTRPTRKPSGLT
ncbi:hypothetical protein ACFSHR_27135 [Azotobacter chroococcum]